MKTITSRGFATTSTKTVSSQATREGYLQRSRRLRQREFVKAPLADNPDFYDFPNERIGTNVDLNWALHQNSIAPSNDAYRNLYQRALLERIPNLGKIIIRKK